ncbi:MAG: hypothetical protein EBU57_08550, partial [Alphaproteobacteria bacterium]|nr:hypothetical protein [Alphaproteobacteria bacterium]
PGTIDSGYRGEIAVILINHDREETFEIKRGDRIAQLVIQQVEIAELVAVQELPTSERGAGGFGDCYRLPVSRGDPASATRRGARRGSPHRWAAPLCPSSAL